MVKVIPTPPPEEPKQIQCRLCKALLEYTSDDLKREFQNKRFVEWINCPACFRRVYVSREDTWQ